jgi:hypothetical protein
MIAGNTAILPVKVAAALSSIQWPLDSFPPMNYQPLADMARIRETQHESSFSSPGSVSPAVWDLLFDDNKINPGCNDDEIYRGIEDTIEALGGSDYTRVAVGLMLLGGGATDECHDLVLPLSWQGETDMGYGTPRPSEAAFEASYAHALVHRREGPNMGEFNMIGWANAHFWTRAAYQQSEKSVDGHTQLWGEVRSAISELAKGNQKAEEWFQEYIIDDLEDDNDWEVRALTELCSLVAAGKPQGDGLEDFASDAAKLELEILTKHCLRKAGFEDNDNNVCTSL